MLLHIGVSAKSGRDITVFNRVVDNPTEAEEYLHDIEAFTMKFFNRIPVIFIPYSNVRIIMTDFYGNIVGQYQVMHPHFLPHHN